jgi:predicted ATPase
MVLINDLVKTRSQFLIATHSPILLAFPKADIIVLDENGFSNKKYYETEHYLLTKQFLDNPERMLNELLR